MWSYYGAKTNVVDFYPAPKHDTLIEPFAGSARYSLKYFDREVILIDKYETIIKIWKWLQLCSSNDVLKLPRMKQGDHIDNFHFDCEEAKLLMGFLLGFSTETPRKTGTIKLTQRPNYINFLLKNIASQLFKIRHWKVRTGSYEEIKNQSATWFIDPPYRLAGERYKHGSGKIDYQHLAKWCKSRKGQVMVCEILGAEWLNFKPFKVHRTRNGSQQEAIWLNEVSVFDNLQLQLF